MDNIETAIALKNEVINLLIETAQNTALSAGGEAIVSVDNIVEKEVLTSISKDIIPALQEIGFNPSFFEESGVLKLKLRIA